MFEFLNNPELGDLAVIGLAMVAGLAVMTLFMALARIWTKPGARERRLNEITARTRGEKPSTSEVKVQLKQKAADLIMKLAPVPKKRDTWQKSKLQDDLLKAGYRSANSVRIFHGIRIVLLLLLPMAGLALGIFLDVRRQVLLIMIFGGVALGYLLPSYILEKQGLARGTKITKQMPNMLDLLVIAVESGLGLDAAIKRVSKDLVTSSPVLAEELSVYSLELKLGSTREIALRNLAKRCGVDEMSSLAGMLIQADRFGVSVGRSLRVYSDELRTKRRQQMEEAAAKIPLKLLFPVLFLIFPAIMAVMAGPALINIMESIID